MNALLAVGFAFSAIASQGDYVPKTPPFRDVPPGHWAAKSVQQLKDEGILVGYPDERFRGALTPDVIHALTRSLVK